MNLSFGEFVEEFMDSLKGQMNIALPAKVVAYHRTQQTVDVQVVVRKRRIDPFTDEETTFLPDVIHDVPVAFPQSAGFSISWPLTAGDFVTLLFCDRSIAEWKNSGSTDTIPQDKRRFSMADAIAIPGGAPYGQGADTSATAMLLSGAQVQLGGPSGGGLAYTASVQAAINELISQLNEWKVVLEGQGIVVTPIGDVTPIPIIEGTTKTTAE